jgi:transcriptional regulator with XRE-family HTH domain
MADPVKKVYRGLRDKTAGLGKDRYRTAYEIVAQQVADMRALRGLSQTELAVMCGTTQSAIARIESGRRPPRVDTLLTIADALQCDVRLELQPRPVSDS